MSLVHQHYIAPTTELTNVPSVPSRRMLSLQSVIGRDGTPKLRGESAHVAHLVRVRVRVRVFRVRVRVRVRVGLELGIGVRVSIGLEAWGEGEGEG